MVPFFVTSLCEAVHDKNLQVPIVVCSEKNLIVCMILCKAFSVRSKGLFTHLIFTAVHQAGLALNLVDQDLEIPAVDSGVADLAVHLVEGNNIFFLFTGNALCMEIVLYIRSTIHTCAQ